MKRTKDKQELVVKANRLIEAHYKLTSQEQKLILTVVAMIKLSDKDFKNYMVPVETFKEIMGVKGQGYHTRLRQKAKALLKKPLSIPQDNGDWLIINWFSSVKILAKKGAVRIRFDPDLKPYLLGLKANFTRYEIQNAAQLSSSYAIRLYELLKQYERTRNKKRELEFKELKMILGCERTYSAYGNFNQRVLKPAQKELKEKTDIGFTYRVRKIGRRVNWIIFTIKPRKKVIIEDGKGHAVDVADIYTKKDIPPEVLQWIPEDHQSSHDVIRDVVNYIDSHGLKYVLQKVSYATRQKPKNYAAYLGNVLKNNLGADHDPKQMELFSENALPLPKIKPGMRVEWRGHEYTVDEQCVIWPESGGAMPPGRIGQLILSGEIKKLDDTLP